MDNVQFNLLIKRNRINIKWFILTLHQLVEFDLWWGIVAVSVDERLLRCLENEKKFIKFCGHQVNLQIAWIQTTSMNATCYMLHFAVHACQNCLLYTLTVLFTQQYGFNYRISSPFRINLNWFMRLTSHRIDRLRIETFCLHFNHSFDQFNFIVKFSAQI